ncbi:MAG: hypothetical protein ACKO41_05210 [Sphingomonadales bacterium]
MFDPKPIRIDTAAMAGSLYAWFGWLKRNFVFFLLFLVLVMLSVWGIHLLSKPSYKATSTFVLEEKSPAAGMSGIASQFGIDLGSLSGGTTGFFSGENISDIIKSNGVIQQVLLSETPDQKKYLADLYLTSAGLRNKRGWKGQLKKFSFKKQTTANHHPLFDTALLVITKRIREKELQIEKTNRKGSIYSVSFTSSNSELATQMTKRLVAVTAKLYVDIKTKNLTANIAKMERKADSLRRLFGAKVSQAYSYQTIDANEAFTQNRIAADVSAGDRTILFGLYAEVMKNLEISRLMLVNQTPVIQVLDDPEQPLEDNRISLLKKFFFAFVFSLLAFLIIGSFSAPARS